MLSWIVLIIALIVFGVLGFWLFSAIFGRGEALPPMPDTIEVKEANLRAVEEGRFEDIQLEVVHRGYRMDQVDALIAQLTGADLSQSFDPAGRVLAAPAEAAPAATVEPVPAVTAPDEVGENSVELAENTVEPEGELTHGSNETAHR